MFKQRILTGLPGTDRMSGASEYIRLRFLYRDLVLKGKARLSLESARGLVGPDCAFHLYRLTDAGKRLKPRSRRVRK